MYSAQLSLTLLASDLLIAPGARPCPKRSEVQGDHDHHGEADEVDHGLVAVN